MREGDTAHGGEPRVTVHSQRPPASAVVSPERDVRTGRPDVHDREDKGRRRDDQRPPEARRPPRFRPRYLVGGIAVVALVTAVVLATGSPDQATDTTLTVAGSSPAVGSTVAIGDTSAPSQPPDDNATTTPGGTGTTSPGLPPALDPERIFGYEVTSTRTLVEVGPNVEIPANEAVGRVGTGVWLCEGGVCSRGGDSSGFAPAAVSFSDSSEMTDPESRCYPITFSLELSRNDDGSYDGTFSIDPAEVFAQWEDGTILSSCTAPRTVDELTLVPLVMLDPAEGPDLSLPAELDPHRIVGYSGGFVEDGVGRGAAVSCSGGYCALDCSPLCSGTLAFAAAAEEWVADSSPSQLCGPGSTSLRLVRAADGSYSGSAVTEFAAEPGPGCPAEIEISLTPVVADG